MKTATKSHIVEIISKKGSARPVDLAQSLGISPQALHRHLKDLVADGLIEAKGSPPHTSYIIAGKPDFTKALEWFQSSSQPDTASEVCETRNVFAARLNHFIPLEERGLGKEDLPLVIATSGEVGNNSFDHNLGQWKDVPGCWFELQVTRKRLWILIADRGQGIFSSISQVVPNIQNDQIAIEKAFSETISGRAPEKRGNGLKYVRNIVTDSPEKGIACRSGSGLIDFGDFGKDCSSVLIDISDKNSGTITLIAWKLHENRS